MIQMLSNGEPGTAETRRLALEAVRRADAMGLLEGAEIGRFDARFVRTLVQRVRKAGIARAPALVFDNVELPDDRALQQLLQMVIAALEQSPVPAHEWPSLSRVFDVEQLAALLNVSVSSSRRYETRSRSTPDAVASRLHFLALVVADLAGAYNDIGVRRWFDRPRSMLGGKRPADLLAGDWDPDDTGPQNVRALAASLVSLTAT
jgi:uncharacterized protein (DUF2384 family)